MIKLFSNPIYKTSAFVLALIVLMAAFVMSLSLGQTNYSLTSTVEALYSYDETSIDHVIIQSTRMPRALVATLIGASLAVAGALMQALTKNPLASPSIFGINSGAVFFVVISALFFSLESMQQYMWVAFLGSAVSTIAVYFLGSIGRDGQTPLKIVLAGSAINALFLSSTQGILVLNEQGLQEVLFWLTGSVSARTIDMILPILPIIIVAIVVGLLLGHPINILMSGDDVAKGLGQRTYLVKAIAGIVIVFLAGGSVALAGSVGFVGLVIPHIARFLIGYDYRSLLPFSAILGATLVLLADVAARFIIMPQEVPIGIMTAFIGAPFFVYFARKGMEK
jgi:iron complex transport system permease protein